MRVLLGAVIKLEEPGRPLANWLRIWPPWRRTTGVTNGSPLGSSAGSGRAEARGVLLVAPGTACAGPGVGNERDTTSVSIGAKEAGRAAPGSWLTYGSCLPPPRLVDPEATVHAPTVATRRRLRELAPRRRSKPSFRPLSFLEPFGRDVEGEKRPALGRQCPNRCQARHCFHRTP